VAASNAKPWATRSRWFSSRISVSNGSADFDHQLLVTSGGDQVRLVSIEVERKVVRGGMHQDVIALLLVPPGDTPLQAAFRGCR
jgi:hypothetical protein